MKKNFSVVLAGCCFILLVLLSAAAEGQDHHLKTPPAAAIKETLPLEPGRTLERGISPGQKHFYKIRLEAGQYARLEAEQLGADVVFSMLTPEGFNMLEFKNVAGGAGGTETTWVAVEQAGEYEFRVVAFHGSQGSGAYRLRIAELRAAAEKELNFTTGMRLTDEGVQLTRENATTADIRRGMEKFLLASEKLRLAGSPRREGVVLRNVGDLYNRLGNRTKAIEYARLAMEQMRRAEWKYGEFKIWQDLGETYLDYGEPEKALDSLLKASAFLPELGNKREEANTLNVLGKTYERIGERRRAVGYYEQALRCAREDEDASSMEIDALNNLGRVFWKLGENEKAREHFQKALALALGTKLRVREAVILNNIARLELELGETDKAGEALDRSLEIFRGLGDKLGEAAVLKSLGQVHLARGNAGGAADFLDRSLAIYRSVEDSQGLADTLLISAKTDFRRGRLDASQAKAEEAISLIEKIRARVSVAGLRDSFSANLQDFYGFYIELLMRRHAEEPGKNYAALALQANERARARGLINLLAESNADIREGVDARLLQKESGLRSLLSARLENLTKVLSGKSKPEEVDRLKGEVEQLRSEHERAQAEIRRASPRYSALTQPKTLDLREIQTEVLDADSVLLEYALGETRSFLWVVAKDAFTPIELPPKKEIETAARAFYDALTARNRKIKFETAAEREDRLRRADREVRKFSAELSRMILAPAAPLLEGKRLLTVADGALHYVPFAALDAPGFDSANPKSKIQNPKSKGFLVETNEIVSLPSASALWVLRREMNNRRPAPKTLAVLADPIFDKGDERFKTLAGKNKSGTENKTEFAGATATDRARTRGDDDEFGGLRDGLELPRLPYTRREAETIGSFVPAAEQEKLLDFDASRRSALSPALSNYRYVHFATHGFINNENPELSGIVLSLLDAGGREQDGFLRVGDIYNLKLPAEIVVLSGCQTGLGKEVRGEGLVGMTRGFMYAGARRVAVSLWNVSDEATADLMGQFYREMLSGRKLPPAAALRQAQIRMIRDDRWPDPYFWSAFVLQGEPR